MSKLSSYVKENREKELKNAPLSEYVKLDENNLTLLSAALYMRISNLEFTTYKSNNAYYLEMDDVIMFYDKIVVKIPFGRTTCYEVASFGKLDRPEKFLFGKYDVKLDAINDNEEFIDIQELLYYCERNAKDIVSANKSTLNKEIDEGFKNPTEKLFDKKSLEEDVKFNEWVHKKFR